MSKDKKEARKNALMKLKESMSKMGGDSLSSHNEGAMKASVVAKDEAGLKSGLEKAAEMMGEKYESSEEVEEAKDDAMDSADEFMELSREELIKRLKNK